MIGLDRTKPVRIPASGDRMISGYETARRCTSSSRRERKSIFWEKKRKKNARGKWALNSNMFVDRKERRSWERRAIYWISNHVRRIYRFIWTNVRLCSNFCVRRVKQRKGVAIKGEIALKLNGADTQLVTTPCLLMSHLYLTHSDPAKFREPTS